MPAPGYSVKEFEGKRWYTRCWIHWTLVNHDQCPYCAENMEEILNTEVEVSPNKRRYPAHRSGVSPPNFRQFNSKQQKKNTFGKW